MTIKKTIFTLFTILLLTACVPKEYVKQESIFIVFKTPTFQHADVGFIYENEKEMKIEIYASGIPVMTLEISEDDICTGFLSCVDKKEFNKKVLSEVYPDKILETIFRGKEIYDGKNVHKTRNGFTQKFIKKDKYNINYSVLNKQIVFRDTINDILIKVKR